LKAQDTLVDINKLDTLLSSDGIVFLTYGGFLSQALIVGMTEALEKEAQVNDVSLKVSTNIFTIFIELAQNMMNYSKQKSKEGFDPKGLIVVGYNNTKNEYYILSRNVISALDKEKIEPKLKEVQALDKESLKNLYRELRKSSRGKHEKGAGIGFIEIARRCDAIEFTFSPIEENSYFFVIKTIIHNTQES